MGIRLARGRRFSPADTLDSPKVMLAAVGIYGALAYAVARRTREIGIRMALGADGAKVRVMVLREALSLSAIGVILGIAGSQRCRVPGFETAETLGHICCQ